MHTHHAVHEAVLTSNQNRSFDKGPCYCQWPFQASRCSAACPKFNASKLVTQRPLVGWVNTSYGELGWSDRQFQGSVCVCVYVCVCVCVSAVNLSNLS